MQLPALDFLYDASSVVVANLPRSNFPEIASDSYDSEWPVTDELRQQMKRVVGTLLKARRA